MAPINFPVLLGFFWFFVFNFCILFLFVCFVFYLFNFRLVSLLLHSILFGKFYIKLEFFPGIAYQLLEAHHIIVQKVDMVYINEYVNFSTPMVLQLFIKSGAPKSNVHL